MTATSSFGDTTYEAAAGLRASAVKETIGLSVDNLDIHGAVTSQRLDEADLLAGLYDDARVEVFRVNWRDTEQRVLVRVGSLGEVQRSDGAFVAEVRGLAHYLQQPKGRLYQYACDADLGDQRCGVDLSASALRGRATVAGVVSSRRFNVTGLDGFAANWFARGVATFASGADSGNRYEVRHHEVIVDTVVIELWQEPVRAAAIGDCIGDHRRLRQGAGDMPQQVRQRRQLPRFCSDAGDGFRDLLRAAGLSCMAHRRTALVTREAIVGVARAWIGTPYHHQASVRGVGADCIGLVRGVWRDLYGFEVCRPPAYSPDWAEAAGEEMLLQAARAHLAERDVAAMLPGDVLVFRFRAGVPAKHAAVLVRPAGMVHAAAGVPVAEVSLSPWWRRRIAGVFAFPGTDTQRNHA